jgi:transposase
VACPITVLPISEPDRIHVHPGKEVRVTMLADVVDIVVGVDTHKSTHTAAVVCAATGGALEELTVDTDPDGYAALVELAERHGGLRAWAIEGTGSYGAGLARFLAERGEWVIELDRPNRPTRRNGAKSDSLDAVRAARDALARPHLATPRSDGERAALAVRMTARRSAVEASTIAQRQLHALVIAAPETLRSRLRNKTTTQMVAVCVRLRVDDRWDTLTHHTATVLRDLARRIGELNREAAHHEHAILELVRSWRPDLLAVFGVGPIVAATVLTAWSHPERIRSEAAFAMLAGTAPIPASSGQTVRHRLNRRGDRQLNCAVHTIALTRLRLDPDTRAYVQRRRAQGKTDREIRRCIKRYITRQLYRQLQNPPSTP